VTGRPQRVDRPGTTWYALRSGLTQEERMCQPPRTAAPVPRTSSARRRSAQTQARRRRNSARVSCGRSTMKYVPRRVDWSKRAGYIRDRHHVEPAWADEAVADPDASWLDPDPASKSGLSVRVVGFSGSADVLLTVILLAADADPDERADGAWGGVNAWPANERDQRLYREKTDEQD
jgi:hypothetical protein